MINSLVNKEVIENAIIIVSNEIENISKEIKFWRDLDEDSLWFELTSCILGSRIRYETAKACADHLKETGLLDINKIIENPYLLKKEISIELNRQIYPPFKEEKGIKYTFHKTKSDFIVETCMRLYHFNQNSIKRILTTSKNEVEARDILIKSCKGIGPKQASLFLRNISYCKNLAILDSHILDFMAFFGLTNERISTVSGNRYFLLEKKLIDYAQSINKDLSRLDFAIWIVMRVVKREYYLWE